MLNDAKKFEAEDKAQRERVDARNHLEQYLFQVKSAVNDYGDKVSSQDKDEATKLIDETLRWLDANQMADKSEYDYKLEEVQKVLGKIMQKLHQQGGQGQQSGAPNPGQSCGQQFRQGGAGGDGPVVEEVD